MIREWLGECDSTHINCRRDTLFPNILPARLIAIGSTSEAKVKIVQTPHRPQYVALSYCWGADQPNSLIGDNLKQYEESIDITSLPKTVQDAIAVTRRLGVEFLWIDSMCILQNSETDKFVEIGKMAGIYNNAYLTIIAAMPSSCEEGFLSTKEFNDSTGLPVPIRLPDNSVGEIILRGGFALGSAHLVEPELEAIMRRAWTFQERFMSKRTLVIHRQLIWMCPQYWGVDGGDLNRRKYHLYVPDLSTTSLSTPTREDWAQISITYSDMQLSYLEDKLPALSSVAEFYALKKKDKYCAGLWNNSLALDLCWDSGYMHHEVLSKDFLKKCIPARVPLRAPGLPSWSFLSIANNRIYYYLSAGKYLRPLIRILSCDCEPASSSAPFGRIGSATLKVVGKALPLRLEGPINEYYWIGASLSFKQEDGKWTCTSEMPTSKWEMESIPADAHAWSWKHTVDSKGNVYICQDTESQPRQIFDLKLHVNIKTDVPWETMVDSDSEARMKDPKYWCDEVWCLPLQLYQDESWDDHGPDKKYINVYGLALKRLPSGEYERVGSFKALKEFAEIVKTFGEEEYSII
jgi:Heterokaryon incompatibility protein (HET)